VTASRSVRRVGWIALTIYAVAMALVEAACVVNLKQLYFADGWTPPFHAIPEAGRRLEQWREVATLVMIAAVSFLGRPPLRLVVARGLWVFGLWDLFYYVFLRLWTGFPAHWGDMDIVFLVPKPWIAPVWSACVVSMVCAVSAQVLSRRKEG